MAIVMPRSRSSGALSMLSKERNCACPCSASVLVIAAVKRRLAVVDVPDRPHVHVRLRPLKLLLAHRSSILLASDRDASTSAIDGPLQHEREAPRGASRRLEPAGAHTRT